MITNLRFTQSDPRRIPSSPRAGPAIFVAMQTSSQPAGPSTPEPSSFAGFLSALAAPVQSSRNTQWNADALAEDVATLSYESALKTHSRYKPSPDPSPDAATPHTETQQQIAPASIAATQAQCPDPAAGEPKSASITIRMSQAECAQLKQRAAQAGMTISAYLRSCTFEAEALRGQVKEALAQLHAAASANEKQPAPTPDRPQKVGWLPRIFSSGAPTRKVQGHSFH